MNPKLTTRWLLTDQLKKSVDRSILSFVSFLRNDCQLDRLRFLNPSFWKMTLNFLRKTKFFLIYQHSFHLILFNESYTCTSNSLSASFRDVFVSVEVVRFPMISAQGTLYSPALNFFG